MKWRGSANDIDDSMTLSISFYSYKLYDCYSADTYQATIGINVILEAVKCRSLKCNEHSQLLMVQHIDCLNLLGY